MRASAVLALQSCALVSARASPPRFRLPLSPGRGAGEVGVCSTTSEGTRESRSCGDAGSVGREAGSWGAGPGSEEGRGGYEEARGALGQICTQVHLRYLSVALTSVPPPPLGDTTVV